LTFGVFYAVQFQDFITGTDSLEEWFEPGKPPKHAHVPGRTNLSFHSWANAGGRSVGVRHMQSADLNDSAGKLYLPVSKWPASRDRCSPFDVDVRIDSLKAGSVCDRFAIYFRLQLIPSYRWLFKAQDYF